LAIRTEGTASIFLEFILRTCWDELSGLSKKHMKNLIETGEG